MKYKNIGSRLLMAASFVYDGNIVCDVGCDHGKLSLYLAKENKAKRIVATDINKKPLQRAVELFSQNNLSDIADFYLTDGLTGIPNTDDITHVVIAGLGGNTMAQVIQHAKFIKENKVTLVLLPAQGVNKIRQFLFNNGYTILEDVTVSENDKYYSCMKAVYTGEIVDCDIFDCYIGKTYLNQNDSSKGYFGLALKQLEKQQLGQISATGEKNQELQTAIDKIKQLI